MNRIVNAAAVAAASLALLATAGSYAQAAQPALTGTTGTPTEITYHFDVPAGKTSGAITIPASVPVLVMWVNNQPGYRGVGQATMLRITGSFLEWVAYDSLSSGATLDDGFSGTAGTHIEYMDYSQEVDLQVASPGTIKVVNNNSSATSITLTLIY